MNKDLQTTMKRYIYYIAAVLINILCCLCPLKAQNPKTVTVAFGRSYAESISLKKDARDMDMILKIVFDEPSNSLTVSLVSYRSLFVFNENVRYKQVIRRGKLRPDQFPYVVESAPDMKYKLTDELKKQIPGCNKKFVFQRWLNYDGLRPHPTDYKMENDYIEQKFDIADMDTLVFISLHDIFVMEPSVKKRNRYDVLHFARLDRTYNIRIERNPCLGKETEIEAARLSVEAVRTGYENLHQRYVSDDNINKESVQVLEEMRQLLVQQFPKRTDTYLCPTINAYIRDYNNYVDSIHFLNDILISIKNERPEMPLSAERIMGIAKIIDRSVIRWLTTTDVMEKEDLVKRCRTLLDEVNQHLYTDVKLNVEQQAAVDVFLKAERYFKVTCEKTK